MTDSIELPRDEVHAWIERLEGSDAMLAEACEILSREENERADRFIQQIHRDRYRICHLRVRRILSGYIGIPAKDLQFSVNEFGKPTLAASSHSKCIDFNLSHSADRMLLGVARDCRIGVDIEEIRPESADLEVAKRFFTHLENQELRSLIGAARIEAFFNCWTRKEAYLKAMGCGLSLDPKSCEVTLLPGDQPAIRKTSIQVAGESWTVHHLQRQRFICAIAVDRKLSLKQKSG